MATPGPLPVPCDKIIVYTLTQLGLMPLSHLYYYPDNNGDYNRHQDQSSVKTGAEDIPYQFAAGHCKEHHDDAE